MGGVVKVGIKLLVPSCVKNPSYSSMCIARVKHLCSFIYIYIYMVVILFYFGFQFVQRLVEEIARLTSLYLCGGFDFKSNAALDMLRC